MTDTPASPHTLILAGGESRRMGGEDKAFVKLGASPLIQHVAQRLGFPKNRILVSTNKDAQLYSIDAAHFIKDTHQPSRGPLEGILAAMVFLTNTPNNAIASPWLLSCPVDCPFVPLDIGEHLLSHAKAKDVSAVISTFQGKRHYLCSLWSLKLVQKLSDHLEGEKYSVLSFLNEITYAEYEFNGELDNATYDPFFNINSAADLREAEIIFDTFIKVQS